jgi:hypothetical protein
MKHYPALSACLKLFAAFLLTFLTLESSMGGTSSVSEETLPPVKLYQLTAPQVIEVMASLARTCRTTAARIAAYSELALGTPYVADSLGEGSGGTCDQDPLMDLSRADCVTFCEQILALAISRGYEEAFQNLQKIRYQRGIIHFATRNHFVMADWLPNNQWLLKNITEETGGPLCQDMVKIINRHDFAASHGCPDVADGTQPQRMSIRYIPTRHLLMTAAQLKGSEILILITTRKGIFASHLGFIIKDKVGGICFRHASLIHKKVMDEPLEHLYRRIESDRQIAGFVLIAVREDQFFPNATR